MVDVLAGSVVEDPGAAVEVVVAPGSVVVLPPGAIDDVVVADGWVVEVVEDSGIDVVVVVPPGGGRSSQSVSSSLPDRHRTDAARP